MGDEEIDTRDAESPCAGFESDGHQILPHCVHCGWSEGAHDTFPASPEGGE